MNQNSKNLMGVLCIAVALFLFWSLDVATFKKVSLYRTTITERQKANSDHRLILAQIATTLSQAQKTITDPTHFDAVIPTKQQSAELITALEKIALGAGVNLQEQNIQAVVAQDTDGYSTLSIALKAQGTYAGTLQLLDGLEKNIRLLDIKSLKLSPTEGGNLDIDISGNAYFFQ